MCISGMHLRTRERERERVVLEGSMYVCVYLRACVAVKGFAEDAFLVCGALLYSPFPPTYRDGN